MRDVSHIAHNKPHICLMCVTHTSYMPYSYSFIRVILVFSHCTCGRWLVWIRRIRAILVFIHTRHTRILTSHMWMVHRECVTVCLSLRSRTPPVSRHHMQKKKPPINGFRPHLNSRVDQVSRPNPLVVVLPRTAARWCGVDAAQPSKPAGGGSSEDCCSLVRRWCRHVYSTPP